MLYEKEQEIRKVCGHNWVRLIAGVKTVGQREMDDLREEMCIEKCLMKWVGYVERMDEVGGVCGENG